VRVFQTGTTDPRGNRPVGSVESRTGIRQNSLFAPTASDARASGRVKPRRGVKALEAIFLNRAALQIYPKTVVDGLGHQNFFRRSSRLGSGRSVYNGADGGQVDM
jgi:hypothetical protein